MQHVKISLWNTRNNSIALSRIFKHLAVNLQSQKLWEINNRTVHLTLLVMLYEQIHQYRQYCHRSLVRGPNHRYGQMYWGFSVALCCSIIPESTWLTSSRETSPLSTRSRSEVMVQPQIWDMIMGLAQDFLEEGSRSSEDSTWCKSLEESYEFSEMHRFDRASWLRSSVIAGFGGIAWEIRCNSSKVQLQKPGIHPYSSPNVTSISQVPVINFSLQYQNRQPPR